MERYFFTLGSSTTLLFKSQGCVSRTSEMNPKEWPHSWGGGRSFCVAFESERELSLNDQFRNLNRVGGGALSNLVRTAKERERAAEFVAGGRKITADTTDINEVLIAR